jgi:preprotein translocase subunit SecF
MTRVWHYQRLKNRHLIAIPLAVAALFLAFILIFGLTLGRDFRGGSVVMVQGLQNVPDPGDVKSAVESSLGRNVDVLPVENGFHIETDTLSEAEENNVKGVLSDQFGISASSVTMESVGPAISSLQIEQILYSIIAAFAVIGVITLIIFRRRIVPIAILIVIGLDIICVFGYMSLLHVPLGLASMVAIVVLITYAVDTNILLVYHVLKGVGGEPRGQAAASMTTGVMTGAVLIVVFLSLNILTGIAQLNLLTATIIFGIVINIFNTWFLSAGLLLREAERRPGKEYHVSL